jgi:hypothetical protein
MKRFTVGLPVVGVKSPAGIIIRPPGTMALGTRPLFH